MKAGPAEMRTPLRRVTGLGSARDGTGHFVKQRLTALANLPLVVFLVVEILLLRGAGRAEIAAHFANPVLAGLTILAVISIALHMRIGVQVVIEDYVHGEWMKIALLVGNLFYALSLAALAVISILMLGFGG